VCDASWIPRLNHNVFPNPRKLFLPQDLPRDEIVQLPVRPMLGDPPRNGRRDPRKPGQFLQACLVDVHLRLGGRLHGSARTLLRPGIRLPFPELCRGKPRHPGQHERDPHSDQEECASHGHMRIAIGVSTLLPVL